VRPLPSRARAFGGACILLFACSMDLDNNHTQAVFDCERAVATIESCCHIQVQDAPGGTCTQFEAHHEDNGCGYSTDHAAQRVRLSEQESACLADAECGPVRDAGLCDSAEGYLSAPRETCGNDDPNDFSDHVECRQSLVPTEVAVPFLKSMEALCGF
jgi:hypothetical protein